METIPSNRLTNLQLELLKLFAMELSESDLEAIKTMIINFLAQRAIQLATTQWEQKELNEDEILNTHLRTPYRDA